MSRKIYNCGVSFFPIRVWVHVTFLTISTCIWDLPSATREWWYLWILWSFFSIVSFSFIWNNSNLSIKTEILDSFTLLVTSCVTSKVYYICCAIVAVNIWLNSSLFNAQNRAFITLHRGWRIFFLFVNPCVIVGTWLLVCHFHNVS